MASRGASGSSWRIVISELLIGTQAVGPRAVEVGERLDRRRVHALVDDPDVEGVGALAGREDDVLIVDRVEVDPGLRVLALDPIADVLLTTQIAGPLDGDRQVALVLMRRVRGLVELYGAGARAVMGRGGVGGGGDEEGQP